MSETRPPFFIASGIRKEYRTHAALSILNGVDLSLAAGEMVAVVGASGTGKTTLLQILGTLDRPTAGSLWYKGEDVFQKNEQELSLFRNRVIGFVFQFHHLLPEFNAIENVMLPGIIAGRPKQELRDHAASLLDKVGVAKRSEHKIGELSGGEQQRVALARALVMNPAVLLADEPTGNLDPKTGFKVFDLIRHLSKTLSLATVMVTHNLELAGRMDRCLKLEDGLLKERSLPSKG